MARDAPRPRPERLVPPPEPRRASGVKPDRFDSWSTRPTRVLAFRPDCRPRSLIRPGRISKSSSLMASSMVGRVPAPEMAKMRALGKSKPVCQICGWHSFPRISAPHNHHSQTLFYLAILLNLLLLLLPSRTILRQSTPRRARRTRGRSLRTAPRNGREETVQGSRRSANGGRRRGGGEAAGCVRRWISAHGEKLALCPGWANRLHR